MSASEKFQFPNGTFGTMKGDTRAEVLRRIDVLRTYFRYCELTNETQTVVMPNGLPVYNVPKGFTVQDVFLLVDAGTSIHDQLIDFPLCCQLQSGAVH